ncbi:MAG: hypothetical protein US68_C0022G0004 [Candidatus Shapirobacteria bacterium GW2011_GWE1_38_10]|uniref:Uncharacterized protein n=1 Tax=Candidatus Shapirobacteria bacterium GW2011_GWE1_38_10 TaxID=1618488 RepID=A0A0G0KI44_9BACT|nr:MAG: hypothetical protein US68_C0022G0004 [Candidatus Shapirobacteria bacterium GW2011_GWE1_38_10]
MLKLSEITFVERIENPIDNENLYIEVKNPTEESIILVTALLSSHSFQTIISKLGKKCGKSHDPKRAISEKEVRILEKRYSEENIIISRIINEYGLGEELVLSVFLLITFKCFIDLNSRYYSPIWFFRYLDDLEKYEMSDYKIDPPCISIKYKCSKNEFITYIQNNWERINESLKKLPTSPILKDKFKEIGLIDEIYQLYEEGITVDDICDRLSQKYPDHPHISGYAWVNNKLSRYKERMKMYSNIFKNKEV